MQLTMNLILLLVFVTFAQRVLVTVMLHPRRLTSYVCHSFSHYQGHFSQGGPDLLMAQIKGTRRWMKPHKAQVNVYCVCVCIAKNRAAGIEAVVRDVYVLVPAPDLVKRFVQKEPCIVTQHCHCNKRPHAEQIVVYRGLMTKSSPALIRGDIQGNMG